MCFSAICFPVSICRKRLGTTVLHEAIPALASIQSFACSVAQMCPKCFFDGVLRNLLQNPPTSAELCGVALWTTCVFKASEIGSTCGISGPQCYQQFPRRGWNDSFLVRGCYTQNALGCDKSSCEKPVSIQAPFSPVDSSKRAAWQSWDNYPSTK